MSAIYWISLWSSTWRAADPDLLERRQPVGPAAQASSDGGIYDVPHLILCTVIGYGLRATPAQ